MKFIRREGIPLTSDILVLSMAIITAVLLSIPYGLDESLTMVEKILAGGLPFIMLFTWVLTTFKIDKKITSKGDKSN